MTIKYVKTICHLGKSECHPCDLSGSMADGTGTCQGFGGYRSQVTYGIMLLVFLHAVLLGVEVDLTASALQGQTAVSQWFSRVNLVIEAWWQCAM